MRKHVRKGAPQTHMRTHGVPQHACARMVMPGWAYARAHIATSTRAQMQRKTHHARKRALNRARIRTARNTECAEQGIATSG
eukprot:5389629-Alexandrium_andersonii.AAC.1